MSVQFPSWTAHKRLAKNTLVLRRMKNCYLWIAQRKWHFQLLFIHIKGFWMSEKCPFRFIQSTNQNYNSNFLCQADCRRSVVINYVRNGLFITKSKDIVKQHLCAQLFALSFIWYHHILMICKRFLIIPTSNNLKISKASSNRIEYIKASVIFHQLVCVIAYSICMIAFECKGVIIVSQRMSHSQIWYYYRFLSNAIENWSIKIAISFGKSTIYCDCP